MTKTGKCVSWTLAAVMMILSIVLLQITSRTAFSNIGADSLFLCVYDITYGYKIRQIITTFVFYVFGFAVSAIIFGKDSLGYASVWAMPISLSLWSVGSMFLLLTGVPYTQFSSVIIFLILTAFLLGKHLGKYKLASWEHIIQIFMIVLSIIIIISTGLLPIIMSSDSYFYVMQYGEIIAKTGELCFDSSGTFMTWTGVSSALMSSAAFMFGFETIIGFHYMLIISMFGLFGITIYRRCMDCHIDNKMCLTITVVSALALLSLPSVELLSSWIISNSHCMVFVVFLMVGIKEYISKQIENTSLYWILVFIMLWLGMSRAEMCVCVAGLVGLASALPLKRKELMIMSGLLLTFQGAFLLRLNVQQTNSCKQVYDSMLTPKIQIIMIGALVSLFVYCTFCDQKLIETIRSNLKPLALISLPIMCMGIYFVDPVKYVTSLDAIAYNLKNEYWGISSLFLLFISFAALFISKRITFYGLFSYGYLFLNLLFALARKQPLRYGYGDSFNRMLISAIPIILLAAVDALIDGVNDRWKN